MPPQRPAPDTAKDAGWVRLGAAIKEDRHRRGWTRPHLVQRVIASGGTLSERALSLVEQGRVGIPGGAHENAAISVWDALGWSDHQRARIQVHGASLPPLPPRRNRPPYPQRPAHALTTRLRATHLEETEDRRAAFLETVHTTRAGLIDLTRSLTALDTDTATHRATAERAVRQLLTAWFFEALAEAEDTAPGDHLIPSAKGLLS